MFANSNIPGEQPWSSLDDADLDGVLDYVCRQKANALAAFSAQSAPGGIIVNARQQTGAAEPALSTGGFGIIAAAMGRVLLPDTPDNVRMGGVTSSLALGSQERNLLQSMETLRLNPYDDQTGKNITAWVPGATIGYGQLIAKNNWNTYKDGITAAQAGALFDSKLQPFVNNVKSNVKVPVHKINLMPWFY